MSRGCCLFVFLDPDAVCLSAFLEVEWIITEDVDITRLTDWLTEGSAAKEPCQPSWMHEEIPPPALKDAEMHAINEKLYKREGKKKTKKPILLSG